MKQIITTFLLFICSLTFGQTYKSIVAEADAFYNNKEYKKSVEKAVEVSKYVDAILLDSGNPNLSIKELGGTGRTHNWELSRQIVESVDRPVFLAGGLRAENVAAAIRAVRPFGIDVCSGVRTNGKLDAVRVAAFVRAVDVVEKAEIERG